MIEDENWNIETAMQSIMRSHNKDFEPIEIDWHQDIPVNEQTLKECLVQLADIMSNHDEGEIFLPIFQRVHNELKDIQAQNELLQYAQQISSREIRV